VAVTELGGRHLRNTAAPQAPLQSSAAHRLPFFCRPLALRGLLWKAVRKRRRALEGLPAQHGEATQEGVAQGSGHTTAGGCAALHGCVCSAAIHPQGVPAASHPQPTCLLNHLRQLKVLLEAGGSDGNVGIHAS
jgi:hypothetical protein